MRPTTFVSSFVAFFALGAPLWAAEMTYVQAYDAAMEASDDCKSAWFRRSRETALDTIRDRGVFMLSTLNPLHLDADRHLEMLTEVTNAIRECSNLTYPD